MTGIENLAQRLAIAAICVYKRYLSPYKGFVCAYRIHTGGSSCSTLGLRAIRRYGVLRGIGLLRERTYLCGVAQRRFGAARTLRPRVHQRGDCDPGCAPDCDLFSGGTSNKIGDALSCCSCGCDGWGNKKKAPRQSKRRKLEERAVHLPFRTR